MLSIALNRKFKIAFIILFLLILILPIIWLATSHFAQLSKFREIENYYYSNSEYFDEISLYFKSLYTENLFRATFNVAKDDDINKVEMEYKTENDYGESVFFSSEIDVSNEKFVIELLELQKMYQPNSEYPVFSFLRTYYDDKGNMLLAVKAYSESKKKKKNIEYTHDTTDFYIVYIDEEYSANGSSLGIDNFGNIKCEPFYDKWYIWAESGDLG